MKNLFFGIITMSVLLFADLTQGYAQTKPSFPFGCRKWTIKAGIGVVNVSTEVTLCCVASNWKFPPITCFEIKQNSKKQQNAYQYIMIAELEQQSGSKITVKEIEIGSDSAIEEDGIKYYLKTQTCKIESNEDGERFVRVLFEAS